MHLNHLLTHNQSALEELAWAIESSQGQFSLLLARCDYANLRSQLLQTLPELCAVNLRFLRLQQTAKALYTRIREELSTGPIEALVILGLDGVGDLDEMLPSVNAVREEFRKNFPFPIVLWVTESLHRKLMQLAPDFESWATTTDFTLPVDVLAATLEDASDRLFSTLLTPDSTHSFRRLSKNLDLGFLQPCEIEAAVRDLQASDRPLSPTLTPHLQTTLHFLRGLNAPTYDQALPHFQHSLFHSSSPPSPSSPSPIPHPPFPIPHPPSPIPHPPLPITPILISGLLHYFIGRTQYNLCNQNKHGQVDWQPAKKSLEACLQCFEQAQRPDLVAKSITQLERILDQMQDWAALEKLVHQSLPLQQIYGDRSREAQDYRYLAQIALQDGRGEEAKRYAQLALAANQEIPEDVRYQGLYLLLMAQVLRCLGERDRAIAYLNQARELGDQGIPRAYIAVLEELRACYLEQKDYLGAFRLKQERLAVEQQYQLRAFVGAGRLRPQRQDWELLHDQQTLDPSDRADSELASIGMAAWQRQRNVKQLLERIGRNDCKLIVIHGYSGVGKSSMVSAGLVPALEEKAIGLQRNSPLVVRVYNNWLTEVCRLLVAEDPVQEANQEPIQTTSSAINQEPIQTTQNSESLIEKLRSLSQNQRLVLIFDQFEEFFFLYPTPSQRRPFFEFLGQCLQILSLKVIILIREDYLHYLLECNWIASIRNLGIDILCQNVLYGLGNFSPADAKAIIQELTDQARFYLDPGLIEQLVQDLMDESGEVRPVELQIIGAQLQTDDIRDLAAYRQLQESGRSPKEVLVERYLADVVGDCGEENQAVAELVLYLLTNENNTRPLKTRADLAQDLGEQTAHLDLVLEIFVRSSLVMLIPDVPADRYQLVHDYLVPYIRQQDGNLLAKLQEERALRNLREDELRQALEKLTTSLQDEQQARQRAEIAEIEALSQSAQALLVSHDQLGALMVAVKAVKQLETTQAPGTTQRRAIATLRQVLYSIQELNRILGHEDWIHTVCFSPDGQLLASGSRDRLIKLWRLDGQILQVFPAQDDWINCLCFSPNGEILASACGDRTIRLWTLDGQERACLLGHQRGVRSLCFSPDGQILASSSNDQTIRLWNLDGQELATFLGHSEGVLDVCFSPDGQMLASGSYDRTIKLWNLAGQELLTLVGHSAAVFGVCFNPDGQHLASGSLDNTIKLWRLNRPAVQGHERQEQELQGQELQTFIGHTDRVVSLQFSPGGRRLASGSGDGTIKLWCLDGRLLQSLTGHREWVHSVAFSPDGQQLVSGSGDRTIRLWSLAQQETRVFTGHGNRITSIDFSPDGKTLAMSSDDRTIRLWDLEHQKLQTLATKLRRLEAIQFSPNGQWLASGQEDCVVIWDLTGQPVRSLGKHEHRVRSLCFSPNGELVAFFTSTMAQLWTVDGQELYTFPAGGWARSICFSPDGQMLAIAAEGGVVRVWSLTGEEICACVSGGKRIGGHCFSPDGRVLAISSNDQGTISLWTLDGKRLRTFPAHAVGVSSLQFSPDGRMLASGSGDRTVKLWNLDGDELHTFTDHDAGVTSICFSPDGNLLASGSCDGTVVLRDLNLFNLAPNQLLIAGYNWLQNYRSIV